MERSFHIHGGLRLRTGYKTAHAVTCASKFGIGARRQRVYISQSSCRTLQDRALAHGFSAALEAMELPGHVRSMETMFPPTRARATALSEDERARLDAAKANPKNAKYFGPGADTYIGMQNSVGWGLEFGSGAIPCLRPNSCIFSVRLGGFLCADEHLAAQGITDGPDFPGLVGLSLSESFKKELSGNSFNAGQYLAHFIASITAGALPPPPPSGPPTGKACSPHPAAAASQGSAAGTGRTCNTPGPDLAAPTTKEPTGKACSPRPAAAASQGSLLVPTLVAGAGVGSTCDTSGPDLAAPTTKAAAANPPSVELQGVIREKEAAKQEALRAENYLLAHTITQEIKALQNGSDRKRMRGKRPVAATLGPGQAFGCTFSRGMEKAYARKPTTLRLSVISHVKMASMSGLVGKKVNLLNAEGGGRKELAPHAVVQAVASGVFTLHGSDAFVEGLSPCNVWVSVVGSTELAGLHIVQDASEVPHYRVLPVTAELKSAILGGGPVDVVLSARLKNAQMDPLQGWFFGGLSGSVCTIYGIVSVSGMQPLAPGQSSGFLTNGRSVRDMRNTSLDPIRGRPGTLYVHTMNLARKMDCIEMPVIRSDRRLAGQRWVYGGLPRDVQASVGGGFFCGASGGKKSRLRSAPQNRLQRATKVEEPR